MPYKCEGANLMHQKGGKWSVKQHTKSHENCVKAMGLLMGIEKSVKKEDVGKPKKKKMTIKRFEKIMR